MWTKLSDNFFSHPKIVAAGRDARDLYLAGLLHCNRHLTDGFIGTEYLRRLAADAEIDNVKRAVSRLVENNLWHVVEKGYQVHDFLDYNPSAEKVRAEKRATIERKSAWERRSERRTYGVTNGVPNGEANSVPDGVPDSVTGDVRTDAPVPVPGSRYKSSGKEALDVHTESLPVETHIVERESKREEKPSRKPQVKKPELEAEIALLQTFRALTSVRFAGDYSAEVTPGVLKSALPSLKQLLELGATPGENGTLALAIRTALTTWSKPEMVTIRAMARNYETLIQPASPTPITEPPKSKADEIAEINAGVISAAVSAGALKAVPRRTYTPDSPETEGRIIEL